MVNLVISRGTTSIGEDGTEVKDKIDINYRDAKGNTALSLAYEEKKHDVIKLLIEKEADLKTIIPSTKKSFMTHVVEDDLFDLVPSLDFDTVLKNGLTPIRVSINSGNYNSFLTLIKKHKTKVNFTDKFGRKAIHYAAAGGNTETVNYLLSYGADINGLDGNGNTTLHYAAANKDGNKNIALLIQKGINVNCQNKDCKRPIHLAIANNNFTNFQILLDHNASLEMKDFKGVESIHPLVVVIALMRNHPITKALLEHNHINMDDIVKICADDKSSHDGYSILHWAAENNRLDIFEALKPYIKSKHINQQTGPGMTPLHYAAAHGNAEMVKSLLKIPGIDINALGGVGYSKVSPIGYSKNAEIVLLLVEAGADIKSKNSKIALTEIVLQFAKNGDSKSLEKLLSHELLRKVIDINATGYVGNYNDVTVLEVAAFQGDMKMLRMLAKYQPNANLKSINEGDVGKAILHYIAEEYTNSNDKSERAKMKDTMTSLILLFNADLTLKNNGGKAPLDYLNDPELKQELRDLSKIINLNIEKYINYLFQEAKIGFWEKEATEERRVRFGEHFSKEVLKNLCDTDKKNFFLSISSDQANDYCQFISNFKSWFFGKDQNGSIEDCIENLSQNFNKLMDEYIYEANNPAKRVKTSHLNNEPSTSFNIPKVEKSDKSCKII